MTMYRSNCELEIGTQLLEFITAIHEENAYEIRFLPEGRNTGNPTSILRYHDDLCFRRSKEDAKARFDSLHPVGLWDWIVSTWAIEGYGGMFLTVNSPNFDAMTTCVTSDRHIRDGGSINAQFVEIDAPQDIASDKGRLQSWKKETYAKIMTYILRPSIVVESHKGFHGYWLTKDAMYNYFRYIQTQLVQAFQGDPACVNPSRVLRLPWLPHMKNPNSQFMVRVRHFDPDLRYTQEQISNCLPQLDTETAVDVARRQRQSSDKKTELQIDHVRKKRILESISEHVRFADVRQSSITCHCCMPDHPDIHPSAWIDTDYMWFHCSGCQVSLPLDELAEELDWDNVIKEWNRYDLDVDAELARMSQSKVSVANLPQLVLRDEEQREVHLMAEKVVERFKFQGQKINSKHKQYIHDILQILHKPGSDKPFLVPLVMGGGKTTVITHFTGELIKVNWEQGGIIVVDRVEDARSIADSINDIAGNTLTYPMYGFREEECLVNNVQGKHFKYCPAKRVGGYNCKLTDHCRYYQQNSDSKAFPWVVMTKKRMSIDSSTLFEKYGHFTNGNGVNLQRQWLLLDERPVMISVETLTMQDFGNYSKDIHRTLKKTNNLDIGILREFTHVVKAIHQLFEEGTGREIVQPIYQEFTFSQPFWKWFYQRYHYEQKEFNLPAILESIVRNGGHKVTTAKGKVSITTSWHGDQGYVKDFHTVIFDGTGDIDPEYLHENYHVLDFEPLRQYSNLGFYECDFVSASKTSLNDEGKLKSLCEDARTIIDGNPGRKVFFPVFKDHEDIVRQHLQDAIDTGTLLVAHFGATRGSNAYRDCDIVIVGGILHKTEDYYIQKARATYVRQGIPLEDVESSVIDGVRRFNDPRIEMVKLLDMVVDYSQEIMRTSQRDNSRDVAGKVYVFHNDKLLLQRLQTKFPGSQIQKWIPTNMVEQSITRKTNNHNQQAFLAYLKQCDEQGITVLSFEGIMDALGFDKNELNKVKNATAIQLYLKANGYEIVKDNRDKRKKRIIKVL